MAGWHPSGTVLVGCNCDYGCPCNFKAQPTTGDCEGGWAWHIEKGHYGDVELDGLTLAVLADWPHVIHECGGKAVAYHDERGRAAARGARESPARRGRSVGDLHQHVMSILDVIPAPIEFEVNDEHSGYPVSGAAVALRARPPDRARVQRRLVRRFDRLPRRGAGQLRPLGQAGRVGAFSYAGS